MGAGSPRRRRSRTATRTARSSRGGILPVTLERRRGPADRRTTSRGPDRRVGARTAARMATARFGGDLEHLKRSITRGDWFEVARVAAGIAGEVGSLLYSGALFPLGLVGHDVPAALADAADAVTVKSSSGAEGHEGADASRPVVLLHGWFHNRSGCLLMAKRFRRAGRRHVFALDLPTARASVPRMSEILDEKIEAICTLTGSRQVDVVAHSLGGLVARWWMTHGGGALRLRSLVTLGAPHKGTALAAFIPVGAAKAVTIGSDVVRALDVPPPAGVRITAIWSDMDYLILPPEMEKPGPGNVRVRYVGHLSLLYSKSVFREIERAMTSSTSAAKATARRRAARGQKGARPR